MSNEDENEEECEACGSSDIEVPDINNAVDYLLQERLILLDWDSVEKDLTEGNKSIVDTMLENTFISVSDQCLLEAGEQVLEVFRQQDKNFENIEQAWNVLVETMSRTYSQCSVDFRENVKEFAESRDQNYTQDYNT